MNDNVDAFIQKTLNMEPRIKALVGAGGYQLLGVGFFAAMALCPVLHGAGKRQAKPV